MNEKFRYSVANDKYKVAFVISAANFNVFPLMDFDFVPTREQYDATIRLYVEKGLVKDVDVYVDVDGDYSEKKVRDEFVPDEDEEPHFDKRRFCAGFRATEQFMDFLKNEGMLDYFHERVFFRVDSNTSNNRFSVRGNKVIIRKEKHDIFKTYLLRIYFADPVYRKKPTAQELIEFQEWEKEQKEQDKDSWKYFDDEYNKDIDIDDEDLADRTLEYIDERIMRDPRYDWSKKQFPEEMVSVISAELARMGIMDGLREIFGRELAFFYQKEDEDGDAYIDGRLNPV